MKTKNILASVLFLFMGIVCIAQVTTPPPPTPPPPPGLPIDSGIVVLFLVALSYGVYKTYKFTKRNLA
ncbi:PID-CTERM protein-sorting domain-containing protein [uncultured Winogradskyella sp.]|uniref:PID-CTERM protein-sorting domain-containing protein n=1 Tax=uncultured Winogradskyella sp. TaxID=395353 RepID=UPI0026383D65|nr:hypothetical protein [uncultured Winogradskyella sp.]